MRNRGSAQSGTTHPAQDFSFIGSRLIQLDALLDAIRVVASPAVAADSLDADKIEELIDVAKHLLREADKTLCDVQCGLSCEKSERLTTT